LRILGLESGRGEGVEEKEQKLGTKPLTAAAAPPLDHPYLAVGGEEHRRRENREIFERRE